VTKLRVHLCTKCGEQTIWSPDGPLHENDSTDHLPDPGRILTLEWDPETCVVQVSGEDNHHREPKVLHEEVGPSSLNLSPLGVDEGIDD